MKKVILVLCIVVAIVSLNACGKEKEEGVSLNKKEKLHKVTETWKKDTVKEVADKLKELVNDEKYMSSVYGYLEKYCDKVRDAEIDDSKSAVVYTVTDDFVENAFAEHEDISFDDLSDVAQEALSASGISIVGSQIVLDLSQSGQLVYSGLVTTESYAIDKAFPNQIWLVPTNEESVYILAALVSNDDLYPVCSVTCRFVYCEEGAEDFLKSVKKRLSEFDIDSEKVKMN